MPDDDGAALAGLASDRFGGLLMATFKLRPGIPQVTRDKHL